MTENVPDSRCDLALRKDPGGHLVEERLEEVMVGTVDDGHIHGGTAERTCREQATES